MICNINFVEHLAEIFFISEVSDLTFSANQTTVIFQVLNHFFDKLALGDVSDAAKLFDDHTNMEVFTPKEKDDYNRYADLVQRTQPL